MILSVIILAAGQGTRMNSDIPKVFHEVGNYPMICHVLDISQKLKAKSKRHPQEKEEAKQKQHASSTTPFDLVCA